SRPYGSWRWGGPEWTGSAGTGAPTKLRAITVAVPDPDDVAGRWGDVLGVEPDATGRVLALDAGGEVRFVQSEGELEPGIVELGGLLGEHHAAGQQEVQRAVRADQAGQQPGDAVLGHQAAAGEGRRELRALGRETLVAHQRLHEADPRARAVDGGDHRLRDG